MITELDQDEIRELHRLVLRELEEINPEIHHSQTSGMRTELRSQRDTLRNLETKLSAWVQKPEPQAEQDIIGAGL